MTLSAAPAKKTPSTWRDMRRDWQNWSPLERLAAGTLGLGTLATAAIYALSVAGF